MDCLGGYDWPGNIRELRNVIERAVILCRGTVITALDLPPEIGAGRGGVTASLGGAFTLPEEGIDMAALERDLILQALDRSDGNQSKAARLLGLGRYALRYRMEKMGLLQPSASRRHEAEA
jgi:two-component system NtrC family response regulator